MNFGTLTIIDGNNGPRLPPDGEGRRGMVRIGGALAPPPGPGHLPNGVTFLVDLRYSDRAYSLLGGGKAPVEGVMATYSKSFKRLASGGNPLKDAKNFVAQFSGCAEAHKLRKRIIATAKTKASISGLEFRFPLEAPSPSYLCVRNKSTEVHRCIPERHFNKKIEEAIGGPYNSPSKCLADCYSESSSSSSVEAP